MTSPAWQSVGMWWWAVCATLAVTGGAVPNLASGGNKVVCYYASWAHYRHGEARYTVQDVPVEQCTHVIYAFAVLDATSLTLVPHDSHLDTAAGFNNYRDFLQLRQRNPQVKLLLGLGGWTDSRSDKYSRLVSQPHRRAAFIDHVLDFFTTYGFDGLDLDWEYPAYNSPDKDRKGFRQWVEELHTAFEPRRLLLTAAVSAGKSVVDRGYDVAAVAKALDQVHLMTYDMHGSWESRVANHAPLFPAPGTDHQLSVDYAVQYWLKKGAPASKLVVGVPLYGRSWTLAGVDDRVGAAASGAGRAGPLMKEAGSLAYYEVCQARQAGWKKVSGADGPHLTSGDQWVGYDDIAAVSRKAEYVRQKGLGGVMLWDVSMDDFHGFCGDGVNPLISAVVQALGGSSIKPRIPRTQRPEELTTSPRPTSRPRSTTINPQPEPAIINMVMDMEECREEGLTGDAASCYYFYRCVGNQIFQFRCPDGLHWCQHCASCDWPEAAGCMD